MRVLHMFTNPHLTNGATVFEYRISEYLKNDGIYFDYLCTEKADSEELRRYKKVGSHVYRLPIDKSHGLLVREIKINRRYYHFFKQHDYDIVYADTENALRSIHLLMARLAGVKVRVVHSHNTNLQTESKTSKMISRFLRRFFIFSATDYFACSDSAAEWLFPPSVYKKKKYRVMNNGIELKAFSYDESKRKNIRKELGIKNELLIGNVGRFMPQKNHCFMLEIFAELLKKKEDAKLLLIGDGKLKGEIEEKIEKLGISKSVIMTGNVPNVNDYLQAMDIFLMPSLFEGLPITGIEAQASGLQCVFSDTITKELQVTDLVNYISLDSSVGKWADEIIRLSEYQRKNMDEEIKNAGYSINDTVDALKEFYLKREKC